MLKGGGWLPTLPPSPGYTLGEQFHLTWLCSLELPLIIFNDKFGNNFFLSWFFLRPSEIISRPSKGARGTCPALKLLVAMWPAHVLAWAINMPTWNPYRKRRTSWWVHMGSTCEPIKIGLQACTQYGIHMVNLKWSHVAFVALIHTPLMICMASILI